MMARATALALLVAAAASPALAAGDAAAGRQQAAACATCHGMDGIAVLPEAPNLAGQNPVYLVKALRDYRSGARKNEMMNLMAQKLTDKQIDDLAAWYASLPAGGKR